jgi:predicted DNA-binding transcriptional regulator AlpA
MPTMVTKSKRKAKVAQPAWLKNSNVRDPSRASVLPDASVLPPNRSGGPLPRLVSKTEVMTMVGASYPTLWAWMRIGTFPRSRVVGGRAKWVEAEVLTWMNALPMRKLKGDATKPVGSSPTGNRK